MRDKRKTLDKKEENLNFKKLFKKQKLQERGITLIALVVTIIILLILAGVTLNIALSDNGLFNKAKKSAEEFEQEQEGEEKEIDRAQALLSEYNGKAEGKKESSKNRALSGKTEGYTYKNPIIPKGFKAVDDGAGWFYKDEEQTEVKGWNDGLVIEDDGGNQFVWVPCSIGEAEDIVEYKKTITLEESPGKLYTIAIPVEDEEKQIGDYGGFYIARFETGKDDGDIPKSKYGVKVWNAINFNNSVKYAKQMINDETKYGSTKSGLVTGKQWDTVLAWFAGSHEGIKSMRQDWGTYFDFDYSVDGAYTTGVISDGIVKRVEGKGSITHVGNTTPRLYHASGLNSNGYKKNVADLAGNFWEWTNDVFVDHGENYAIRRGRRSSG